MTRTQPRPTFPIIGLFGSSQPREGSPDYGEARDVGRALAEAGFIVMNGGYGGTMEASARGAREAGGHVIGVTVEGNFGLKRRPNEWIDEEIPARTLLERLEILLHRPAGFIALKGGSGTLAEIALAWEFGNKDLFHPPAEKPLALLGDFWSPLIELIAREDTATRRGPANRFVFTAASPGEAVLGIQSRLRCIP